MALGEVPTSRPLGIPSEAWSRMSEREKEEAIRTRDVIDRKSKLKPAPKKSPASGGDIVAAEEADDEAGSDREFEGYSPDGAEGVVAPDPEAEKVERYARERGSDTDEESDTAPAMPGVDVEFEPENDYAFHNDGFDVPEREEIAAAGKKIDAVPCTPIFDRGERLAKDLFQRGRHSRKDIMKALRLANLKTRFNARTIDVAGQPAPKRLDTWVFGLYNRGGIVGITNDTKRRPWSARLVTSMIREERPGVEFSAFSINQNLEIGMHRDTTNLKGTSSAVIGLNKFGGGQLHSCG